MRPDIFFDEATHTYLVDGHEVPSVTEILEPLHRSYGKVNPSVLDYAANRGRAVHEVLEMIDYGADPEVSPEIVGYLNAYQEWAQIYKPSWEYIEHIVVTLSYGYAGTLDRAGWLNGNDYCIVDIKTSQPTKEALVSVCCQTAAYQLALEEHRPLPNVLPKRYGLFLKPDGSFRFLDCNEYEVKYKFNGFRVFHVLRKTYQEVSKILETGGKK